MTMIGQVSADIIERLSGATLNDVEDAAQRLGCSPWRLLEAVLGLD
jgi:hypothetical protein